jgi:uncharacterized membrane protein (DUF373 family)
MNARIVEIFNRTVDIVFGIILVLIILAIAIGTLQLFVSVWNLLRFEGITGHFIDLIADILTLYVLVELSRSLIEYFDSSKLRMTFIVDAAIVFIIREILISLFKHDIDAGMLYAFSSLLLVLGVLRIGSVLVYQREKLMLEESGKK